MEKISAKGGMYVLLPLVLLSLSSMVGAVDIIFYSSTSECSGSGTSFNSIAAQTCCVASGGSVLFTDMDACKTSQVYNNGGCDSGEVGSATGNICYTGGGFTSGFWFSSCRRRSLLGEAESNLTKCQSQAEPTGVVYTEDSSKI